MTDISRVSTYAIFQTTLQDSSSVEAQLANLQGQLSSGQVSQNYQGIASQSQQFVDLENQISKSDQYVTNNTLVSSRLDSTNSALTQVIDVGQQLQSLIQTRETGTEGDNSTFSLQLQQQWQSIASALNTQLGGQYLFSGTATNIAPVDANTYPTTLQSGVPDSSYYNGSNQDITLRADDDTQMTYNVRANSPGIQQIVAGLALAKQGDTDNNTTELQQAYSLVQSGLQGVIATQSTVNSNKVSLTDTNQNQASLKLYWQGVQQGISNTDLVSVSTQVAVDQGILQASFEAFAKINSLSLASFLPSS